MSDENSLTHPNDNSSSPGNLTGTYRSCPLDPFGAVSPIPDDTYTFHSSGNDSPIPDDATHIYQFDPSDNDSPIPDDSTNIYPNHQGPNNQFNPQNLSDAGSSIDDSSDYYHGFPLDERPVCTLTFF